jgi:hypothetical protein
MVSHNHFKQPIRAFVLDMFDIQLDGYLLDRIRTTGHLLRRVSGPTVNGRDDHEQQKKSAGRDSTDRLGVQPEAQSIRNTNDPNFGNRHPIAPIAKQQGFESRQERGEVLFD